MPRASRPIVSGMDQQPAAMHVARIRSSHTDKQGRRRGYESRYLRRTYRDGSSVKHETLANLSGLPEQTVDAIEAALKGTPLVPAAAAVTITASVPHGHVAAVHAMAAKLGLPALLGPACAERDLALALIISRVAAPASKLSTIHWWADTTLGTDLAAAASARRPARRGWRCSTCPAPGWRGRTVRWPPVATPGTARRAACRSSTGCSPTLRAGRPLCWWCPATP